MSEIYPNRSSVSLNIFVIIVIIVVRAHPTRTALRQPRARVTLLFFIFNYHDDGGSVITPRRAVHTPIVSPRRARPAVYRQKKRRVFFPFQRASVRTRHVIMRPAGTAKTHEDCDAFLLRRNARCRGP